MNSVSIDILPMNAPINSLYNFTFLLSISDTDNSNKKSNPKLISSTMSKYIFILITNLIIKKRHYK